MENTGVPHVVILPFPAMGHMKPMLKLGELLSHRTAGNLHVTYFITDHNYDRLLRSTDLKSFYDHFHNFRFITIPDGVLADNPRPGGSLTFEEVFMSIRKASKPRFRECVISLGEGKNRPTCIIADGIMSFALDVGEEVGIPVITFRTYSASCTWTYFHLSKLIEGVVPFEGFENVFRNRDLPGICRNNEESVRKIFINETKTMRRASALILNTFDELEQPIISKLTSLFPKIYTIGPLNALSNTFIDNSTPLASSTGILRQEDKTTKQWLDSQQPRSTLYVSFGSLVSFNHNQMLEFWHGLVNSKVKFMWVIRPDSLIGNQEESGRVPEELEKGTKERGYIVDWAPQEEVLAHPAVGGFLTHSGWNSTLESIHAVVGMICWPAFADQQVNSRCVSEIWRNGFDMKDTCDRSTVEIMVRRLMECGGGDEMRRSTDEIARMACESVEVGGTSYCNLERLIQDIRSM